jgi:hypothetical protein
MLTLFIHNQHCAFDWQNKLSTLKDANFSAARFVQVRHNLICIAKYHYYNNFACNLLKQNFITRKNKQNVQQTSYIAHKIAVYHQCN